MAAAPLYLVPDDSSLVDASEAVEGSEPWLKLPRESDADFARFRAYLDSGYPSGYSGVFVSRQIGDLAKALGVPVQDVQRHAYSFQWAQRSGAWDREVDKRKRLAELDDVTRLRDAHLRFGKKLRNLSEAELDKMISMSMGQPDAPVLSAKEMLAAGDLALRIERSLASSPGAKDPDVEQVDLENLGIGDLEELHKILQKAKR